MSSPAAPPQTPPKKKNGLKLLEKPPPPISPSPQKKKKKKKMISEILEEPPSPPSPPQTSPSPEKKRKSEILEEPPVAPPQKKKKKKKKRGSEVLEKQEAPSPQKTSRGLEETPAPPPSKREYEEEEELFTPNSLIQKKKKKKRRSEKEVRISPAANGGQSLEEGSAEEQEKKQDVKRTRLATEEQFNWVLVEELEEFVPDVKRKSVDQIRKLLHYDLHRFKAFKEQGISLRKGRCSQMENKQIMKNVADFLTLTGIPSAQQLLFPQRFKGQEAEIRKLKAQHRFLERIANGIPRTCQQVYTRAKKLFDDRNHMGRFSEEEIHSLRKLQKLHGNDWKAISQKMDRSVFALQKRFVSLSSGIGTWETDEESRLRQAVRTHLETLVQENPGLGLSKHQLCNNLPWKWISEQVQTRAWSQCRLKWFSILRPRLSRGRRIFDRGSKGLQTKINLINILYQMGVEDLADVDWNQVSDAIGDVSPNYIQKNFHRLKVLKVPHWSRLTFGEIVDFLKNSVLPELQERLKQSGGEEAELGANGAGNEEEQYHISDIFSPLEEVDNS
ncbi:unnamed protein product [Ophioblennius macclurei]